MDINILLTFSKKEVIDMQIDIGSLKRLIAFDDGKNLYKIFTVNFVEPVIKLLEKRNSNLLKRNLKELIERRDVLFEVVQEVKSINENSFKILNYYLNEVKVLCNEIENDMKISFDEKLREFYELKELIKNI